jgi:hypothetical protein
MLQIFLLNIFFSVLVFGYHVPQNRIFHSLSSTVVGGSFGGDRWTDLEATKLKIIGPVAVFHHMGSMVDSPPSQTDVEGEIKKAKFNLNVGKALDILHKQLPLVFYLSNLDFSIFANQISVADSNQNKIVMQKNLYVAAVRSLKVAATISSMYPSMNVRKIEYIDDIRTIQCLVNVVLPDSVRVEGQVS